MEYGDGGDGIYGYSGGSQAEVGIIRGNPTTGVDRLVLSYKKESKEHKSETKGI